MPPDTGRAERQIETVKDLKVVNCTDIIYRSFVSRGPYHPARRCLEGVAIVLKQLHTLPVHVYIGLVVVVVGCLTSQQHASLSQGRISSDNCTCYHSEVEVADQTFQLTQSQYTDTWPASLSADPWRVATGVPISKSLV